MCACLSVAAFSALSASLPARAGIWFVTVTGPATATASPSATPSPNGLPVSGGFSVTANYSLSTGAGQGPGQPVSAGVSVKCPLHVAVAWQPNGSLASDPEPATVRLTESGSASWSATGSNGTTAYTTGSGSASVAGLASGTMQYPTTSFSGLDHQIQAKADSTCSPPATQTGSVGVSASFTYTVQVSSVGASLTVDQDQQVLPVAATTRFSATISSPSGFTVDSVKISVDGTPATATVNPNNPNNYYIDWPQSGGNPSEHTVTATAQIHDSVGAISLNSLDAPNRPYNTSGMGRPADDIIADVHLQSIKFNSNIALSQDAVTPVPSPEFTWTAGSTSPATANPAAYIQGKNVNLTLLLGSSAGAALTGDATMGYLCKLQANPNTTNPATNAADPVLTLYDNTTASPTVPASCGASTTIAATTALNGWVAPYTTSFPVLTFYVEFTKIPTPTWSVLSSYNSSVGNTVYATVAAPTAPMAKPWARVLGLACNWAARDATAAAATHDLVTNEYLHCTYNGGYVADTAPPDDGTSPDSKEIFYLADFLSGTARPYAGSLQGQCDDFSDFLSCISNAVGALPLQPQRSQTLAAINNSTDPTSITTTLLLGANALPPTATYPKTWNYHQFTDASGSIFDGSVRLGGTTTVENLSGPALGSNYYHVFIASTRHADPSKDWNPVSPLSVDVRNNKP